MMFFSLFLGNNLCMTFYILICLILSIFRFKSNRLLKTSQKLKKATIKNCILFSKKLCLNFYNLYDKKTMSLSTMTKVDEILTRVKINTPILYNSLVDYTILHKSGINTDYPIYITEEYNQQLHYYIQKAMNFVKFNWVIITSSNILINKKQIIENQFIKVIDKNSVALKLQTEIYKLNINYGEHKKLIYENIESEFTIWGQQDLFYKEQFNGLFLYKIYENQNVKIILKKYYYNGLFYNLFIQNKTTKKIKLGYAIKNKIKLNNTNYYIYKYHKNCVKVFNLKGINQCNCVFDNKNKLIFQV